MAYSTTYLAFQHFFLLLSKETFSNSKPSKGMVNVQRFHSMGKNHYTKNSWFSVFFPKKQTQFPIQSHSAKFIFEEGVKNRLASNKDRILKILSGVENLFPHRILTKVSFHIWADVQACQHFAF